MAEIGEKDLLDQIKTKNLSSIYFIYGEDNYLKQKYVKRLSETAVTDLPEMNFPKIDGKEVSAQQISDETYQFPLMSEKRCVLIDDFDIVSKGKEEIDAVKEILKDVPETTVLIFVFSSVDVDYKKAGWSDIIKTASKYGCVINCKFKTDADLVKYIRVWGEKQKTAIDSNVARYLIETVGKDLKKLETEVDKLCAFCKNYVTKDDIDRISAKTPEATQYMLPKSILSENISGSLNILSDLLDMNYEPIIILNAIADSFIDIYRVKTAVENGLKPREIAETFKYSKNRLFVLDNAAKYAKKYSVSTLEKCFDVLNDADSGLKGDEKNKRLLLERTIILLIEALRGYEIKAKKV